METIRMALWAVIKRFVIAVLSTIGILIAFGFLMEFLEKIINNNLYKSIGSGAVLFTAIIGTPLHEISHWFFCKLFGFTVIDVELLRPIAYKTDGVLGYVSFAQTSDNLWTDIGKVFVGVAPMLLGSLFILLAIRLIKPEVITGIVTEVSNTTEKKNFFKLFKSAFLGFWKGLFSKEKWGIVRGIICLYISMSISMHMTVSPQDIKSASGGFVTIGILYLIYSVITAMIGKDFLPQAAKRAAYITAFFSIGLFMDLILLLVSFII